MASRKFWHLGNTTVRSPFRLRDGLVALDSSDLQGDLHGEEQEIAFRDLLGSRGIVELGEDETNSVGRKWRSALTKLGFLIPDLKNVDELGIGKADTISENGRRLINSTTIPAMQECFLRALAAYSIPNPGEKYVFPAFSPLKYVLSVMSELETRTRESKITQNEIAFFVESTTPADKLEHTVEKIISYRKQRAAAENKRAFDNAIRSELAEGLDYRETTFNDYADTTVRYLKATGLVVASGRGISFFLDKRTLIKQIVNEARVPVESVEYYKTLCAGSELPSDEIINAREIYFDLVDRAAKRGVPVKKVSAETIADITIARHEIEELLFRRDEEDYALNQEKMNGDILKYLDIFITNSRQSSSDENGVAVPSSERPAYLEWVLWRAFLAIDNLENKPYEARRFNVDQSLLPVGTAPGNGPDLIFEFKDFILAVEATLTENSRQEAAEGESVRRHVAQLAAQNKKPVYGLFVARNIDTNTVNTFKHGSWFSGDEEVRKALVLSTQRSLWALFFSLNRTKLFKLCCLTLCTSPRTPDQLQVGRRGRIE